MFVRPARSVDPWLIYYVAIGLLVAMVALVVAPSMILYRSFQTSNAVAMRRSRLRGSSCSRNPTTNAYMICPLLPALGVRWCQATRSRGVYLLTIEGRGIGNELDQRRFKISAIRITDLSKT
ncbi:MAG TPA: hypothetical protein VK607_25545, partial [Kofleriaceae bacterium]|nr:hypothetical protein [Kofleriaceae bacterium]